MTKVCVFVDGENLRHTITELFSPQPFDKRDYLPQSANWGAFFDDLVSRATDGAGKRVRTYWYVIDLVDCFPFVIKRTQQTDQALLEWQQENEKGLRKAGKWDGLQGAQNVQNLKTLHDGMWSDRENIKRRFDGFHVVQDKIAHSHKAIEFRRSGSIGYNLLTKKLGQEKTVDANLSVDVVLLKNNYDMALIVSGDQDYVPAAQAAKNFGKHVVNVAFEAQNGTLLPGGARRLNNITDWSVSVPYADFKGALGI